MSLFFIEEDIHKRILPKIIGAAGYPTITTPIPSSRHNRENSHNLPGFEMIIGTTGESF